MLIQQGEGSRTPTEPHHTPSQEAEQSSHTHNSSPSIPTVILSETTPIRQYTRRARIAQSSALPPIADEHASPVRDVTPRVTSPAVKEGSMQQSINELMALCTSLQRQYSELLAKFQAQEGRSMDEGEAAIERVSDDTEEMANVLTSMDATTVLASRVVDVPTGSGSIPTASTPAEGSVPTGSGSIPTASTPAEGSVPTGSKEVSTASPVFAFVTATVVTPVTRRKGKEYVDGLDSNNETVAKYLEEYHQFSSELPMERRIELISDLAKDFKGMTFEKVEAKFNLVCKQMEDFIPMGSKEEAERIKRKGINLEQESIKKQKSSEEITEEAKSPEEVHTEGQRAYWKITRLGGSSASYQFFTDLLKHLDRDDLNQLWSLVKETLSKRPATSDKEMELWVELSRLYEPDVEDQLWTHTQNFMHAPAEWKIYEKCGVHQLTSKDKDIFMLVEKDYLLRKGLALVM
nr:hypothetical protein [Tanacetum cinerariifolium]